ncbi:uncharacterized protein LOC130046482 [Ostrea edulis]|uniref:uncharacterized protein LOC130046482 n=1 Tax=Ostrea edulis TaxID=37623 RepID=UPI0024AEE688|nr:uncharacterized protein LOC130046482 [Ostrea edulis]
MSDEGLIIFYNIYYNGYTSANYEMFLQNNLLLIEMKLVNIGVNSGNNSRVENLKVKICRISVLNITVIECLPDMLGFVFITILLKLVHPAEGDCHVNNWPLSCEANFKVGPDKCEPCEAGKYGCNCSQDCTVNTYGLNCYLKCNCSVDELCDPAVGCVSFNITSTYKTFTQQTSVSASSSSSSSSTTPSSSSEAQETTTVLRNSAAPLKPLTMFNAVIIALAASLVLVVTLSISCIVIVLRRNSKKGTKTATKTKNSEEMSETAEQNPDFHSYLTISERSFRLYADVHYDEAEERKSLTSVSLHSKGYDTSISDKSGGSGYYLTPTVKTAKKDTNGSQSSVTPTVKTAQKDATGSQSSGDYDDTITNCSETCI